MSQLELQYGRVDVQGGDTFTGRVPDPLDDPGNERGTQLVAVTAARALERGPAVAPPRSDEGPGTPPRGGNMEPPERPTLLDRPSLLDLSEQVTGLRLSWTAPEGHWIVFGFWSRPTLQNGGNLVSLFDADSVAAAADYVQANQLGPGNLELLRAGGGGVFEDSLEYSAQSLFWSRALLAEFSCRRGYELIPHLPLLFVQGVSRYWVSETEPFSDFSLPEKADERIRADYYRLLDDLYAEEHIAAFVAWADGLGLRFRTQPAYGQNLNVTRAARETVRVGGLVDDETLNAGGWGYPPAETPPYDTQSTHWRFALDHYRSLGEQRCAQITHVSADGADWISAVVADRCVSAVRCADPFHVVRWATDALDEVRRQAWNTARGAVIQRRTGRASGHAEALKHARYALWKSPENLTSRQQAKLAWIAKTDPRLHRAYLLKEALRLIFQLSADEAAHAVQVWIGWARRCRIAAFVDLQRRIVTHRDSILAAIEHGLSNGRIESVNTKIRLITRIAFGFRSPQALIALAMLNLGGHRPVLPGRT